MAVDTEDRRRSAMQFPFTTVLPVADGTISGADKQHIVWLYRGILASGATVDHQMFKGMGDP